MNDSAPPNKLELPNNISTIYPYDGDPIYDSFINSKNLKLCGYKWRVENPVAIVIAIHGIQSHCRFEFLCHPVLNPSTNSPQLCTYEGSWVHIFNQKRITFCGLDLQSHGFSQGWNGTRCNIDAFDDMTDDVIQYIKRVVQQEMEILDKTKCFPPICIMGISMGGCIGLRTIEKLAQSKDDLIFLESQKSEENCTNQEFQAKITTCISLAPMLSIEKSKKQLIARLFLNFADLISEHLPYLKVAKVEKNTLYPFVDAAKEKDPLVPYSSKIAVRISNELMKGINQTMLDIQFFPKHLKVLFVHSINDTQCEIQGSERFFELLTDHPNKSLWKLKSFWHCLTHETQNADLADSIITWTLSENPNDYTPIVSKI